MNRVLIAFILIAGIIYYIPYSKDQKVLQQEHIKAETIACLRSYIGTPHSSKSSDGLDCSALVQKCYSKTGIDLPRDSRSQFKVGKTITKENARVGDLIFFLGSNLTSHSVGHSGIITLVESDNIQFIHSTLSKGVIESHLSENYYKKRFKGIRRIN